MLPTITSFRLDGKQDCFCLVQIDVTQITHLKFYYRRLQSINAVFTRSTNDNPPQFELTVRRLDPICSPYLHNFFIGTSAF
jgi:hypothetical protein